MNLENFNNDKLPSEAQIKKNFRLTEGKKIGFVKSQRNRYIEAATSNNTRKAYRSDIRHFERWGGLLPASVELVVKYLHEYAETLSARTLERRLVALSNWHEYQGFADPTGSPLVKKTLKGIKNVHGRPKDKAPALTLDHLELMVEYLRDQAEQGSLIACRNNAVLQVGFFGAFRRSELTAIRYEDLKEVQEGVEITIPRSKSDQMGEGLVCALPYGNEEFCPVRALKEWLERSQIREGYVFRAIGKGGQIKSASLSSRMVSLIIKSAAGACRIQNGEKFSGHSLRRGLATSASQRGAPLQAIMRQGRWRHYGTVLGYIEEGQRFSGNVVDVILNKKI